MLYGINIPIASWAVSRDTIPKPEKRTLARALYSVCEFICVTALSRSKERPSPCPGARILTRFPFGNRAELKILSSLITALADALGPTYPQANAVRVEPFSTSVFKDLTWIFATTTKICTNGSSSWAHAQSLQRTHYDPLTRHDQSCCQTSSQWRRSIGLPLQRHPFSGLVDSAGELLHTP